MPLSCVYRLIHKSLRQ